jgi:hypothetical protein
MAVRAGVGTAEDLLPGQAASPKKINKQAVPVIVNVLAGVGARIGLQRAAGD